jgi:hypothetical protein
MGERTGLVSVNMRLYFLTIAALMSCVTVHAAETFKELDPSRITAVSAMLPENPTGFGHPASDRATWEDSRIVAQLGNVIAKAEALLNKPFPAWDDDAYLDFSRTGSRPKGEAMLRQRQAWLYPLVMAECMENNGRFIPQIDVAINEYVKQPTWVLPAHDAKLVTFHRTSYFVDLNSSAFANELAETLYLLGDKISPETRAKVPDALESRVFGPMRESFKTGKGEWWLTADHNWNAVCLAGVTGAALTILPDRKDRALFVAAAEHYSQHYLAGFTDDGYCCEGTGYWNYGFGSFIALREQLVQSTAGQIDLFKDPKIKNMALYGLRIQMIDRSVPPFADCHFGTTPDDRLLRYCNRSLGLGIAGLKPVDKVSGGGVVSAMMDLFPGAPATTEPNAPAPDIDLRSFFKDAGVLVCRPDPNSSCHLAVAIKGGGNGNHSHDDVGSFVIALGDDQPVGDPGGPKEYNDKTFGPQRFTFKLLNSFGHPVPVVAGQLQRQATEAHPKVLETKFTAQTDEISIDITSAYAVPELKSLVRTLKYNRQNQGSITVEDNVAFSSPQGFQMGLPIHSQWRQIDTTTLEFTSPHGRLIATIDTPDGFDLTTETIDEFGGPPFSRLGLKLKKPITTAVIRMTFRPTPL